MSELTLEGLRDVLHYDPETGRFIWLQSLAHRVRIGDEAGWNNGRGYRRIRIEGQTYYAHRLAWFYMTGAWPGKHIDHINGQPGDDRWLNLREATQSENMANAAMRGNNTSGVTGVSFNRHYGKWESYIAFNGKRHKLGMHADKNAAIAARRAAETAIHGEFARAA